MHLAKRTYAHSIYDRMLSLDSHFQQIDNALDKLKCVEKILLKQSTLLSLSKSLLGKSVVRIASKAT